MRRCNSNYWFTSFFLLGFGHINIAEASQPTIKNPVVPNGIINKWGQIRLFFGLPIFAGLNLLPYSASA